MNKNVAFARLFIEENESKGTITQLFLSTVCITRLCVCIWGLDPTLLLSWQQCLQVPFVWSLYLYRLFRTASPFDRRITALEWHPMHPSTVAVGSKGGDIILWNYEMLNKACFIKGVSWSCKVWLALTCWWKPWVIIKLFLKNQGCLSPYFERMEMR